VVGAVDHWSSCSIGCCRCVLCASLFFGAGRGHFSSIWTLGRPYLVHVRVSLWRLIVLVSGVSCMLGHVVGFSWMIQVGLFLPGRGCESYLSFSSVLVWFVLVFVFCCAIRYLVWSVHRWYGCRSWYPLLLYRWSTYILCVARIFFLLHVLSSTCPIVSHLYAMALIMFGLWCFGLLCFGSRVFGVSMGYCVVALSFCSPSWVTFWACREWSSCGMVVSNLVSAL